MFLPTTLDKIKDGKMVRFGSCAASSLIWEGGGGLLFHFILSKIVVWRRLVDATGDSKSLLPEAYLLILEKIASIQALGGQYIFMFLL